MEWYFTTHTTFGELFAQPECRDIAEYFIYSHGPRRLQDEMTLQDQKKKNPNRHTDSMCDGVNHLLDKVRQGVPPTWDFWSQEEREKDYRIKSNTKLFYFPADSGSKQRPFVMICAGGGYSSVCSLFEGFPMARRLNQLGYTAFVLNYRVGREGLLPGSHRRFCGGASLCAGACGYLRSCRYRLCGCRIFGRRAFGGRVGNGKCGLCTLWAAQARRFVPGVSRDRYGTGCAAKRRRNEGFDGGRR